MKLKIKKLDKKAVIPSYAHDGDACFDIRILLDGERNRPLVSDGKKLLECEPPESLDKEQCRKVMLRKGSTIVFRTGLAFEIERGYVMKVHVRSSTGIMYGVVLANGTGIIDSGYRGELYIALTNNGGLDVLLADGDRVAQAEITKVEDVTIEEVEELGDSDRGTGGIGSTGCK